MSKPAISESASGYILTWEDCSLTIKASRVDVHKEGRVTGELLITTNLKDYNPILHPQTQFNFSAQRTRNELISTLQKDFPDWSWKEIINQTCYHVQELSRQGAPLQEIWTGDVDIKPPIYLIKPIIYEGVPTIFYGEKGSLKSTTAQVLYIALTLPWHDNLLGLETPNTSVKTIYLDWEVESNLVSWNMKKLQLGMKLPDIPIYYRRCEAPLADDIDQIKKYVTEADAKAVVIDSLGQAAGGELKDAEVALKFYKGLRQLKVTSYILAQTSKNEEGKKSVYGSTFFEYYARSVYEIRKVQQEGEDDVSVGLFHKYCNLSKLNPPMGFKMHFSETAITVERQDVKTFAEFKARLNTQTRILEELKQGGRTTKELLTILEVSRASIDMAIKRLKDKKSINMLDGKWVLSSTREDFN